MASLSLERVEVEPLVHLSEARIHKKMLRMRREETSCWHTVRENATERQSELAPSPYLQILEDGLVIWEVTQNVFLMFKYFYQEDAVCPSARQCHCEGGMVKVPLNTPRCLLLQGCAFSLCVSNPGSSFKSPLDAVKKVDDGIMLGLGYNHLIKDSQWEQREGIFCSTYPECLEAEGERKNEEEIPR